MPICPKCGIAFLSKEKLKKHYAFAHELPKPQEQGLLRVNGEYLGGHAAYPSRCPISLTIDKSEVLVHPLNMHIPFSAIKEVKNIDESQMSALRVVALGVAGALWKKKERYLCLVYNDELQEENPVFKLGISDLEKVQSLVYEQVVKARQLQK